MSLELLSYNASDRYLNPYYSVGTPDYGYHIIRRGPSGGGGGGNAAMPDMRGQQTSEAEARYAQGVRTTFDTSSVQSYLDRMQAAAQQGNADKDAAERAAAILRNNPEVAVVVGGQALQGEQAAQAVERQQAQQHAAAQQQLAAAAGYTAATPDNQIAVSRGVDLGRTVRDMIAERSAGFFGGQTGASGEFAGGRLAVPVGTSDTQWAVVQRSLRMFASAAGLPEDERASFVAEWSQRLAAAGETSLYHYAADGVRQRAYTVEEFGAVREAGSFTSHLTEQWQPGMMEDLRRRAAASEEVVRVTMSDAAQRQAAGQQAESPEGFRSFVVGGLAGSFSTNDSYSAMAGQTVIGLTPLGVAADARDIAAAGHEVYEGKPGAWGRLGLAAVAIIPGLDFLKGGSRAGMRALREAAAAPFERVVQEGLEQLGTRLSRETVEQVDAEIRVLTMAREEMLTRLDILASDPAVGQNARSVIETAYNSLTRNFRQSEMVGAVRDVHGVPVVINGVAQDHLQEVRQVVNSLGNAREQLLLNLRQHQPGTSEYRRLSQEAEALDEIARRISDFLRVR